MRTFKIHLVFSIQLLAFSLSSRAAFTEFYCDHGISSTNINAGSTTSATAAYTSTSGNWDGTSLFLPTDGSNPSSTVAVGDWASVYNDGATVAVYVARVTTVTNAVNGGIILSTSAKAGTAPTSNATQRSIKVGGCWYGPYGTENFPFGFATSTLTNTSGNPFRCNFKGGTTYAVTAAITSNKAGPIRWQGYTNAVGDLGKATIDGGTVAGFTLFTQSGNANDFADFIFANNGTNGSSDMLNITTSVNSFNRVVCHDAWKRGFANASGGVNTFVECEAYNCNKSNTAASGAFHSTIGVNFVRCIAHDNTNSAVDGFFVTGAGTHTFISCIAANNGRKGIHLNATADVPGNVINCDFYNNGSHGLDITNGTAVGSSYCIVNCNFIKNGGWGITNTANIATNVSGVIQNCGFGSGSQANTSGTLPATFGTFLVEGSATYASGVTPWVDPANGDFRINLAAAKAAGIGSFLETKSGFSGTIGYPDIGAAQHRDGPKMSATAQ